MLLHPAIGAGGHRKAVAPSGKEPAQHQTQNHQDQVHHATSIRSIPEARTVRPAPPAEKPLDAARNGFINELTNRGWPQNRPAATTRHDRSMMDVRKCRRHAADGSL
ncbi:MAG TPA: hypothetical protein VFV87_10215 [Pirellulaceae bacterium]|nr:hypothetical protein [Pirellulaceae bacterium]